MAALKTLSVFFPAYNEENNIAATVSKAIITLEELHLAGYEIIVVDDGSSDRTAEIVENLAKKNSRIRLVHHQRNRGYGAALKTGFSSSKFDWVAFTDSDGQFGFQEINKFLDFVPDYQVIIGYRKHRCDSKFRRLMAFLLRAWDTTLFGLNLKDVDCGFKLIKKSVIDRVFPLATESAITETEMMAKIHRAGFSIKQIGVAHHSRTEGIQTGGNFKVIFKAVVESVKLFLHLNPFLPFLITILSAAAFLRLYRIRDYIVFLGDEGRDALVWLNIVEKGKFTLLGPTASVSGFYLGPIYYYLTLPFYWIWRDPVGPAIFVALIGIATVWLIWFINKKWFGPVAGLFSAWTYASANLIIRYSRASWNPNPLPFFSLLGLYWLVNGIQHKKFWQITGAGLCLGIAIQLHYLALILFPVFAIITLLEILPKFQMRLPLTVYCLLITGFVIGFSPFLAFEIRHHFPNTVSIFEFTTRPSGEVLKFEPIGFVRSIIHNFYRLFYNVFSWPGDITAHTVTIVIIFLGTTGAIIKKRLSLLLWIFLSIVILSLYQGNIENYYYGFLFPVPFILAGISTELLFRKSQFFQPLIIIIAILFSLNQSNYWFINHQPNHILEQTNLVANKVILLSGNNPYNFALITAGNSDHAYRYFLEKLKYPPVPLEKQITNQLVVICEKPEPKCQPLGNAIWEIAGFGRAEIIQKVSVPPGITIYKLIHYYEN